MEFLLYSVTTPPATRQLGHQKIKEALFGTRAWPRATGGPPGTLAGRPRSGPRPNSSPRAWRTGFPIYNAMPSRVMPGASATTPPSVLPRHWLTSTMNMEIWLWLYHHSRHVDLQCFGYVHRDSTEPLDSLPIGTCMMSRLMDSDIQ